MLQITKLQNNEKKTILILYCDFSIKFKTYLTQKSVYVRVFVISKLMFLFFKLPLKLQFLPKKKDPT